jgi:hypothetical protein
MEMRASWQQSMKSWLSLAAIAVAALAVSATLSGVHAQSDESDNDEAAAAVTAYAEFQNATLSGSNNVINVTMLPIVLANGHIVYENLVIPVTVNPTTGKLTLGTMSQAAAPQPNADGFKAGNYVGPGGTAGGMLLSLYGPGVTSGGATEWTVATTSGGTGCAYPSTATFYVGSLANNPFASRLKKAGITSTAYSYGVMGSQECSAGDWWENGALVGFSQTGNALNIVSFSYAGSDYNTVQAQITYIYQ